MAREQPNIEIVSFDILGDEAVRERAFSVLAKALAGDDIATYLGKEGYGEEFMLAVVRMAMSCHPHARIHATPDFSAVAITSNSTVPDLEASPELNKAIDAFVHPTRGHHTARLFPALDEEKAAYIQTQGNVIHLHFIGALERGKGLGGALLNHVLEESRAAGLPAYLEATSPASSRLYARKSFAHVKEFRLTDDASPFFLMASRQD